MYQEEAKWENAELNNEILGATLKQVKSISMTVRVCIKGGTIPMNQDQENIF